MTKEDNIKKLCDLISDVESMPAGVHKAFTNLHEELSLLLNKVNTGKGYILVSLDPQEEGHDYGYHISTLTNCREDLVFGSLVDHMIRKNSSLFFERLEMALEGGADENDNLNGKHKEPHH